MQPVRPPISISPRPHRPATAFYGLLRPLACAKLTQRRRIDTLLRRNESIKLQHQREGTNYRRLSEPLKLLSFDWAHASLDSLGATAGESRRLPLRITRSGALTTLVVYLTLDLDGDPGNVINTGPDSPNRAWDQCARHLPVPLRVEKGDSLTLLARHTDCYLQTLEISGFNPGSLASSSTPGCAVEGQRHLVRNPGARGLSVSLQ